MSRFEVLEGCRATKIERVLANASVAGTRSLAACDVCEPMLDGNTLPQSVASGRRRNEMAEALLERLVGGNTHLTAAVHRLRAFPPHGAGAARLPVEADGCVELEALGLALRARDRAVADVDVEVRLGEQPAIRELPRSADHLALFAMTCPTKSLAM